MIRYLFVGLVCLVSSFSFAQNDSLLLNYDQYIQLVAQHHPVMVQAELFAEESNAYRLKAKGYFDPKISGGFSSKDFDQKDYYQLLNGALKIPTWVGADIKVDYENNRGQFLDKSDFLPDQGLISVGISVPLGRGLFFDERRKALRDADIFEQSNELKRILLLNNLLYEASLAYLEWQSNQAVVKIREEGLQLAELRFDIIKKSFINGDKPAIDTLESYIALQSRNNELVKALQDLNSSAQNLNNFLWIDGRLPVELGDATAPTEIEEDRFRPEMDSINLVKDDLLRNHPELLVYDLKDEKLDLEQRLNRENLKPDLRLNYNPLVRVDDRNSLSSLVTENYKLGVDFSYPIFTRKERGAIKLTDIAIRENELKRRIKQQNLNVKFEVLLANENYLNQQTNLLTQTSEDYARLLDAEYKKLSIGESSVFMVNAREMKYLEFREKLIEAQVKTLKNRIKLIQAVALNTL